MSKVTVLRDLARLVPGMSAIVMLATGIGLTFNGLSPDGLPLVRKPLRETRRFATAPELLSPLPSQPTKGSLSLVAAPATSHVTTYLTSRRSSDLLTKDTQKQLSRVDGEIPTTAKPLKAKPIMPVVRNEKSIPVASNQVRISALHTETKGLARQSKKSVQALFTTLDDAKSLFDRNAAIFLDGRPAVDYEAEHIQGAISLYTEDVDDLYGKVLGNVSKDKVIVTYCSDPECTEATKLADILATKGFTKVVILLEGLPGWKEAGYPTAKAKESK